MIVRNSYTGALHDVPDHELYEVPQPAYDGFGNPVGGFLDDIGSVVGSVLGPIAPLAKAVLPAVSTMLNPAGALTSVAGNLLGSLIPGSSPAAPPPAAVPMAPPGYPAPMPAGYPGAMPMPGQYPQPYPPGWSQSPGPYGSMAPQRFYMRCSMWPGPKGLVPQAAMAMPDGAPGTYLPGVVSQPAVAVAPVGGGHRRFFHRRR